MVSLVVLIAARAGAAVEPPPELAAVREFRKTLIETRAADQALLKSILAEGVKNGLWTADDTLRVEASFIKLEETKPRSGGFRYRGRFVLPGFALYASLAALRTIDNSQRWTDFTRAVLDELIENTFLTESSLAADFAEKVWCEARSLEELKPARAVLEEVRKSDLESWNASPNVLGSSADKHFQIFEASQVHSIIGSEDGFLPPDPASDINGYRRWQERWMGLVREKHPFVERPRAWARFAALEARFLDVDLHMGNQLLELLQRDAPASEFPAVLKPYQSSPAVRQDGAARQAYRIAFKDGQFVLDENQPESRGVPLVTDYSTFGAYAVIWELRVAEESGDVGAIAQAQARVDQVRSLLRPALAGALAERKAKRLAAATKTEGGPEGQRPATSTEILLAKLEAPPMKPVEGASGRADAGTRPYDVRLAAEIRGLADERPSGGDETLTSYWIAAISARFELADLRDRAAREQVAAVLKIAPNSMDKTAPLSVLWDEALDAVVKKGRYDDGDRLVWMARVFGAFSEEQMNRWATALPLLHSLREKGQDKRRTKDICRQILSQPYGLGVIEQASARLKSLRAGGK